jgi:proteic killer suppression protein
MTTTLGDKATALSFRGGFVRSPPTQIQSAAHRTLLMIDAAVSVKDLDTPPGNRLASLQVLRSR